MSTLTITLSDEKLLALRKLAGDLGVEPEELIRLSVDDLLTRSDDAFEKAVTKVLEKNAELYKRLA
ncbi:MAG: DNA-binding protein [Chloroflexi bacterium]|nr:DNA-binding protein [Chloroflexota bacterium]